MSRENFYALYKGDEILTIGTKKELALYLGVKERTIEYYITPTYRKRNKGGELMVKVSLEIKEDGDTINVHFVDPTKKQLSEATENEKVVAQKIKDKFNKVIELLEDED